MFARVKRRDGTLEPTLYKVDVENEPQPDEYVTLEDGRRAQVVVYVRGEDDRAGYLIVVLP